MIDQNKIVDYLTSYRISKNIDQKTLGEKLQITQQNVWAMENKKHVGLQIEKLNQWCKALGLDALDVIIQIHTIPLPSELETIEQKRILKDALYLADELKKNLEKLV